VGVDHPVEPPSWRPEGAASAVTEEATAAPGQADAPDEQESRNGVHDLNGAGGDTQPELEPEPAAPDTAPLNGNQESPDPDEDPISYSKDDSLSYGLPAPDGSVYTADYPAAQSGYNDGVSQSGYSDGISPPVGGESTVPPYPAELPSQPSATATAKPAVVAAATQALPEPRPKNSQKKEARRANLVIARLEPWSVMKFSFLMSLVAWVVLFVAVVLLYYALSGLGVFAAIQRTLSSVTSSQSSAGVNLASWTSPSRVLGYTMLIGAFDIIIITVLSTLGAVIYNLVTHLGGGIEVTLKETD
jgi:hypothetical protein